MSEPIAILSVLVSLFDRLAAAPDLVATNIAFGIAGQELRGEWDGCPLDCKCADCEAFDAVRAA